MDSFQFVNSIVPATGHYFIWAQNKKEDKIKQKCYDSIDTAVQAAHQFDANGYDAYFAVSSFETDKGGRKQDNVLHTKALFLDLDVGEDKVANRKGYANKLEAATALRDFCEKNKLPAPTVVDSGRGINVYWALTEAVPPLQWKPVAERLKALCAQDGLLCDPAVPADSARVLRVPTTHNHKDIPPKEVTVHDDTIEFHNFDDFAALLGDPMPVPAVYLPKSQLQTLMDHDSALNGYDQNYANSFKSIMLKTLEGKGCEQIHIIATDQETIDEPLWRAGLSIAKFCYDGDTAAHKISCNHPDYNENETNKKLDGIEGPHTCATFNGLNLGVCEECPHWGKIKSPVVLGREFQVAVVPPVVTGWDTEPTAKDVSVDYRPPLPFPYAWGANDAGVYMEKQDDDGNSLKPDKIYHNNLYVAERVNDEGGDGQCVVIKEVKALDGLNEFCSPMSRVVSGDFAKEFATYGVALGRNKEQVRQYIIDSIKYLESKRLTIPVTRQFGWTKDRKGFIIGNRELRANDITRENYPSPSTSPFFEPMTPKGTLEGWKFMANSYNAPNMEVRQFMILAGLASPLMELIDGVACCGIHVFSKTGGLGKTSALHAGISPWGHPEDLRLEADDTINMRMLRTETYKNLPVMVDEMTNVEGKILSSLLYKMTTGIQRGRMEGSSNSERKRGGRWSLLCLTTANTSILDQIGTFKSNPNAEAQRIMECVFERVAWDVDVSKFNEALANNYGHAGPFFMQHVLDNLEDVKEEIEIYRKWVIKRYNLSAENRFWASGLAVILVTGYIANKIGLLEFDMKGIETYAGKLVEYNQQNMDEKEYGVGEIVSKYIQEHWGNRVQVTGANSELFGSKLSNERPNFMTNSTLLMRIETGTKRVVLELANFKNWLAETQIGDNSTIKAIEAQLDGKVQNNVNLTKDTEFNTGSCRALVIENFDLGDDENVH